MTYDELIKSDNPLIKFDAAGRPITPDVILANKDGSYIGLLTYVEGLDEAHYMNSPDEISFTIDKEVNGIKCQYWDDIRDFKLVYTPQINDWYEIQVNTDEKNNLVKSVTGVHAQEAELSQRLVFETEINTEDDIAREDYVVTKFYDEDNPKGSLLNRLLADKCQDYSIFHVDNSLREIQRTFSFNGKSVKDCFDEVADEVECLFVYGESLDDDGKLHRTVSAYDLLDHCIDCGERGTYTNGVCTHCGSHNIIKGYGTDTNIFVSRENIASSVTLKSNADNVKNCFRLEAGDDVMTAVVRSINPNSSQYIWYFTDDTKADMSEELRTKLAEYDELYNEYRDSHVMGRIPQDIITNYNLLIDKYGNYGENLEKIDYPIEGTTNLVDADYKARYAYDFLKTVMMPTSPDVTDTTAQEQIQNLTVETLSPIGLGPDKNLANVSVSTADSAVLAYAKLYVDTSRYRVTVSSSSYTNPVWSGIITVSSYTKDEDTASTQVLNLTLNIATDTYLKQQIEKTMDKMETQKLGAVALFNLTLGQFQTEIKKYSHSYLSILRDIATAALNILIEQGVGEAQSDLYTQIYTPYFQKSAALESELKEREQDLSVLLAPTKDASLGLIDYIEKQREIVKDALDMYEFIGEDLWQELMAFRRDDTYQNRNFISDGLSDSELIDNAKEFYKAAMKEIVKSATLQNSLSGKLQNFLIMPEFQDLAQYVKLGNKIYMEIDDKIFQLRLISYEIDYDNIDDIDIDFADVTRIGDIMSDTKSILDQARSIASSYNATARQANKGSRADEMLNNFVVNGLDLTAKKIVNTAENQNMVFDENGMYMRRALDFEDGYSPEQVKIINAGLYYTKDNWLTVKAGIGHFKYLDPGDDFQEKDGYGVIADTVMGDLIIGSKLRIYNSNGSLQMTSNGTIFTLRNGADNTGVFKIRSEVSAGTYTDLMYINANNKLVIRGEDIEISSGQNLPTYIDEIAARHGGYELDTTFTWSQDGTTANFTAKIYNGENDVTADYDASWFEWYLRTEGGESRIAVGKTCSVLKSTLGYGGTITCVFTTYDNTEAALTTRSLNTLRTSSGLRLTTFTNAQGDQPVTDLPVKLSGSVNMNDNIMGIDAADGYQLAISELGKVILNLFTQDVGGTTRSIKDAVVANQTAITTKVSKSGDTMTGPLTLSDDSIVQLNFTTTSGGSTSYIKVYDDSNQSANGNNMVIQSGGSLVIGSGESAQTVYNNNLDSSAGTAEHAFLTSDGVINLYTNVNDYNNRKKWTFGSDGNMFAHGWVNVSDPSWTVGDIPSSDIFGYGYMLRDSQDHMMAYFRPRYVSNGRTGFQLQAVRDINGTNAYNGLNLLLDENGNKSVALTDPSIWRDALGINNSAYSVDAGDTSVPTGSDKTLCSTSLSAGTYIIQFVSNFATTSSGRKVLFLSLSNDGQTISRYTRVDGSPEQNFLAGVYLLGISSTTTIYLNAYQTSGAAITVNGGMRILKIH